MVSMSRNISHILWLSTFVLFAQTACLMCVCLCILQCKVYLVEDVLMNFLLGILEGGGSVDEHPLIQQLLELFWLLMEVTSLCSICTGRLGGVGVSYRPYSSTVICIKTSRGEIHANHSYSFSFMFAFCVFFASSFLRQDFEVNECLKQLMMSLLRAYRFSPIIPDLGFQVRHSSSPS